MGGFHGGYNDAGVKLTYRSTEMNLDAYEFFSQLAVAADHRGLTSAAGHYRNAATRAGEFVIRMWDAADGKFWTGTLPDSDAINTASVPTDVQFWTHQTLGQSAEFGSRLDYRRAVDWAVAHLAVTDGSLRGYGFSSGSVAASPQHVWLEGTAQGATTFALLGTDYNSLRQQALSTLELARQSLPGAEGVPAASRDHLVDPAFPAVAYDKRAHLGATAWTYTSRGQE